MITGWKPALAALALVFCSTASALSRGAAPAACAAPRSARGS